MDVVYLRPFTNPKRVKLVSTCDVCKNRKVKCDRERPECGTCKKTNRKCSYTYAALTETMRDKQTGMRAQADSNFFQTQLNYLQKMQFGQLYDESGYLSMASRGFGIDVNNSQHVPGMLTRPMISMTTNSNVYDAPDDTSTLASEVLQYTSDIVSSIPKDTQQQQYDPYYLNDNDFSVLIHQVPQLSENYLPQTSIPPQQIHQESHQQLSPQQSSHQQMPQQPPPHQPPQQLPQQVPQRQPQQFTQQRHHVSNEDTVMEDLITNIKNMNLYESTRYIGEGSLLMLDEEDIGEMIIPQMTKDISEVDKSLKILPNEKTAIELIHLYYKHVHRYFPAIRKEIVWNAHEVVRNAPGNLSTPQHLLLLNCIFFIASPFHDDPDKKNGRIYFDRAEALLYEYCTQPHVLTVMAIILLGQHNKQIGSRWMYNGIATKMLFELGLHRKFKKVEMDKEIEKMRNEAFWMTFISENLVSATYGRPNMIDETDCDVDVPLMPSDQNPTDENTKLEIAYIYLINLSRICARVRKYMHAASRLRFLMQDDENKFRVLDAALASWFNSLPDWLKFEKIVKDPDGILLNGIGGDIHIFFYTILILLHSRYMKPQAQYNVNTTNSSIICIQSATIIVHWLEILLDKHKDFFRFSVSGSLAINPAMCVFSWHINNESENNKKSRDMLQRLEIMKQQVDELFNIGKIDCIERRLLGIESNRVGNHEINAREWEVFIPDNADDVESIRRRYSWIARKQSGGGHFMPRKQKSKSLSYSSKMYNFGSRYDFMGQQDTQDFNFTFKTDKTFNFSAFSSGQNPDLPQLTVGGVIVDEPEQFDHQDNQQFGSQYHTPLQRTPSQQSPQLEPQQFHTPLSQSPQLQLQEDYHSSQLHHSSQEYNSPLGQSPHISPHISHEGMDAKPQHIDTNLSKLLSQQQYIDQLDDKCNNINNNVLWTPPLSARPQPQRWNHDELSSNTLTPTSLPVENTMLTPPMQPQDFLSGSLNEFAGDELWNVLQNEDNFGTASKYDNNSGYNNDEEYDSVGLGISVMGNNNIQ